MTSNVVPLTVQKGVAGYICAQCGSQMGVTDSRSTAEGYVRRRRVCRNCEYRESTIELPINSDRPAKIRALRKELKETVKALLTHCNDLEDAFDGR